MTMEKMHELKIMLENQVKIVDEILNRYINDEAGELQKDKYEAMDDLEKVSLLTNTLVSCPCWDDFETEIVINFDYNNY